LQEEYNQKHGITPTSIRKSIRAGIEAEAAAHARANAAVGRTDDAQYITEEYLSELEAEMYEASENLDFERAAAIRDQISKLRDSIGKTVGEVDWRSQRGDGKDSKGRKGRSRVPHPKKRA
jgi:excinuclease ABC subunit B